MKIIRRGFALPMLIIAWPVFANDAPPSDVSIQELLMLTRSEELQRMTQIRTEAEQEIKALPARK